MEFFQRIREQLTALWTGLSMAMKITISVVTVVAIAAVVGVSIWANQQPYDTLYSGLSEADLSAVVTELDNQGVQYQLTGGEKTTVQVPTAQIPKVRMDLAMKGLPSGPGKGFELFDETSLGMTPFVQNVNYIRAAQSELARTIMQLETVEQARVHIVQPEPTPFIREEKPVTASVMIRTQQGKALTRESISAIIALVAGSVRGLNPDAVTILDSEGHLLSDKVRQPEDDFSSDRKLKYQQRVEAHLATKAQEVLSRLIGPGRAVVRVTADITYTQSKTVSERFDPEERALRHEVAKTVETTGGGSGGVAGAASNLSPVVPTAFNQGEGENRNEESVESDYEISKTMVESSVDEGKVGRLTVAVMLVPPPVEEEMTTEEALGISIKDTEALVKQAIGFDDKRGDAIQVSVAPPELLVKPAEEEIAEAVSALETITLVQIVSAVAALVLAGLILWFELRRRRKKEEPVDESGLSEEEKDLVERLVKALQPWLRTA